MITSFFYSSEDEIPRFTSLRIGMTWKLFGKMRREATAIRSYLPKKRNTSFESPLLPST
ncbi:MAG TPA: hypothetical protein PLR88_07855 [Bacteroidales bacterium]|nr:hypothetical protein [Bacteroidales bacterium]